MWHSFVKAIVFFRLVKAISFSTRFTFLIEAMTLFIFIINICFFSLDLHLYNLNISRMSLIKTLLFLKIESLLAESTIPKMAVSVVKVGKIKLF